MSRLNYSNEHYTWKKAFQYGVMSDHAKQVVAKEGRLGNRLVHALITALHLLPLIGNITQLAEAIIVTKHRDKDRQLGFNDAQGDFPQIGFQVGTFYLYGSMLTKPQPLEAMACFNDAARLEHTGAMVYTAFNDDRMGHLMQRAAEKNHPVALRFQSIELSKALHHFWLGRQMVYLNYNDDLSGISMTEEEFRTAAEKKCAEIQNKLKNIPQEFPHDINTQLLFEHALKGREMIPGVEIGGAPNYRPQDQL